MARQRLVTRTIMETTAKVMTVFNRQVTDITVSIGTVKGLTEKQIEDRVKNALPEDHMFVQVVGLSTEEKLYGMPEDEFMKYAKLLPPRAKADATE